MKQEDKISRPKHYNLMGVIEPLDFIMSWDFNFLEGNIIKYLCRYKYKRNRLQDLQKAQFYLKRLIDEQSKKYPVR